MVPLVIISALLDFLVIVFYLVICYFRIALRFCERGQKAAAIVVWAQCGLATKVLSFLAAFGEVGCCHRHFIDGIVKTLLHAVESLNHKAQFVPVLNF